MQIDKMSARLRLRSSWEAIDLGFSLARRWFLPLWLLWLVPALCVSALSLTLIDSVFGALLLIWWLQPLYERPLLHFLSRALFGEYPTLRHELRNYWRITKPQLLPTLLWRRFNPGRSLVEPVVLLEGLKGKARRKRLNVLRIGISGTAVWFGILCWLFGRTLDGSQLTLLYMLVPEEWNLWFAENIFSNILNWRYWQDLHWLGWLVWLLSTSLIAPFFIAGGFALYISRRTHLEGWDIELAFRQLVSRQQQRTATNNKGATTVLLLMLALPLISSNHCEAAEVTAQQPSQQQIDDKALIDRITAQPEFGEIDTHRVWEAIKKKEESTDKATLTSLDELFAWIKEVAPAIGLFIKVLLVLAIAALVIWLLVRFTSWLDWLQLPARKQRRKAPPSSLFGLELNKDSLPDSVADVALALLNDGQLRNALSLLFRATLSHMVHYSQLPISDSTTESECLQLAQAHRPASELNYFRQLTNAWLLLAYGHQPPSIELTRELCHNWPQHYHEDNHEDNSNKERNEGASK